MFASPLFTLLEAVPRYAQLTLSQYASRDRLDAIRRTRPRKTFEAAMRIPFYAKRFGAMPTLDDLPKLPILQRAELDEITRSVLSIHRPDDNIIKVKTSGTTGQSAEILFDRSHQSGRNAARARYLVENGWLPTHRTAWALGLRPEPPSPDSILSSSHYMLGSQFMSHTEDFTKQIAWMRKMNPHFIYTLPSNLDALLMILAKEDPRLPALRKVFLGGEVLDDSLRARTRQILGVDIVDNYGTTEFFPAWQCPEGSYHLNLEHLIVELLDDDGAPTRPGEFGRVVVTTLENYVAPMIRYEIGDYAMAVEGSCPCGRTLPLIGKVVGRSINLFRLKNGELYLPWRIYDFLEGLDDLRKLQLVQRAVDHFVIKFVRDEPLAPDVEAAIRKRIADGIGGGVTVDLERVDDIPRTARGKFMAALCEIAPVELDANSQ